MTSAEAIRLAHEKEFRYVAGSISPKPSKEWFACIASNLHNEMKDSALCCYVGLCGTEFCPYKLTGKPPEDWMEKNKKNENPSV